MRTSIARLYCVLFTMLVPAAAAAQTVAFGSRTSFPTGDNPQLIAMADVNNDGRADAITAGSTVAVATARPDGTFAAAVVYEGLGEIMDLATGDVNRDGNLDIVVARSTGVTVLLGTGANPGSFLARVQTATSWPTRIALGDFNKDGRLDLATTSYVLRGDGTGAFGPEVILNSRSSSPADLITADLNSDGNLDLIFTNWLSDQVSVHLGTATGTFPTRSDYGTGDVPASVAVGDLNGDGRLDVVTGNLLNLSIFLGSGTGTLGAPTTLASSPLAVTSFRHLTLVDANGDGRLDVVMQASANYVSVRLGTGTGSFGAEVTAISSATGLHFVVTDADLDGRPDLAFADGALDADTFSVALNRTAFAGAGAFTTRIDVPTIYGPSAIALADMNRDGKLDVTVSDGSIDTSVQFGSGTGTFANPINPMRAGANARTLDVNLDGKFDVAGMYTNNLLGIYFGAGDGTYSGGSYPNVGYHPSAIAFADLNRDGRLDLLAANYDFNFVSVMLGLAAGGFGTRADFPVGERPKDLATADLNRDGILDLVVLNSYSNSVTTLLGDGNGILGSRSDRDLGGAPTGMAVADMNNDGRVDLVVSDTGYFYDGGPKMRVYLGTGTGQFEPYSSVTHAAGPESPVVADFNRDGNMDVAVIQRSENPGVTVHLGRGDGTLDAGIDYATGYYPHAIDVGDVNRDGRIDIVTSNEEANSLTVLLNGAPAAADLSVTLTAAAEPVVSGSRLRFTVTARVINNGPGSAAGTTLRLFLPGSTVPVVRVLGTIASGSTVSVALSVVVGLTQTSPLTTTATVSANVIDANLANNSASATVTVGSVATMTLDRGSLQFAAVSNGASFVSQTSAQTVRLTQSGLGSVTWTATASEPWLTVSPSSGTGSAMVTIGVRFANSMPVPADLGGAVSFTFSGATTNGASVSVLLRTLQNGSSAAPFGVVDTPLDNATGVTGAVPMTGWALDDVEVANVSICRGLVSGEGVRVEPRCGGASEIFLGNGVFVEGARTDVQAAYPNHPRSYVAGWGFMILTNMLPNQGNGVSVFSIYAADREGNVRVIGTRRFTADNANATLPFGTIDTPAQGETISGSQYVNFGWALTQNPKSIPTDGSTITVHVDGTAIGTVSYNHYRPDIAGLFPGLANSNGAVGYRVIDTTTLANGLHTIVWTATDSAGRTEGLGSRYFRVSNGVAAPAVAAASTAGATANIDTVDQLPADDASIRGRRGWQDTAPSRVYTARSGRIVVRGEELDRFELELGEHDGETYAGYVRAGAELNPLPVGSELDAESGRFVWSPGVGFIGSYDFVFVRSAGGRAVARRDVRIVLSPKGSGRIGPQVVIDGSGSLQEIAQPFALRGSAVDLDAGDGTGIDAVQVWAHPADGASPIFLGTAAYGIARPDAAAVHGGQFSNAGFSMTIQGLAPGTYDLTVLARSTVHGASAPAVAMRVTVR